MKTYKIALKMNVSPDFYPKCIAHIWDKRAIVLLIVDLLDFPGSVWPHILDTLGPNKKILLVGNKADMLPQDSSKYLNRVAESLKKTFLAKCKENSKHFREPNIVATCLVSARTKFNIEHMISQVYRSWNEKDAYVGCDVYLVGTTNVGKSSIFNLLLESDLCKVIAMNNVEKAMTSPVPGTTLNLLKFPIMRPDPGRLHKRILRLKKTAQVFSRQEKKRLELLRTYKDQKYAIRRGTVGTTFWKPDKYMPLTGLGFEMDTQKTPNEKLPNRLNPLHPKFADGYWCYDTPGTVSEDQIINLLTQEEVMLMSSEMPWSPKSFLIRNGQTMFIGGLARIDLVQGPFKLHPLLFTLYCSDNLPINMVRTEEADQFYAEALGTDFLKVPTGSEVRLKDFPALEGKEFEIDGVTFQESSCDLVLSSVGWISCVPKNHEFCTLKAWTPGGRGLFLRQYPFLPFGHTLRGTRIMGAPTFANDQIFLPD